MANLSGSLGNLSIHFLLMKSHGLKLRGQLVDRRTKNFVNLSLSHYELLHETLQV